MEEKDKIVFIKVRASTREELKRHGIKGDTYDTIINQLIEVSDNFRETYKEDGEWVDK